MSTTMTTSGPRRAASARSRALAVAMLLMAGMPATQAACQYKQLGAIPANWVDRRLIIDGSVNNARLKMAIDTGTAWTTLSSVVAARLEVPLAATVTVWQGADGETSGTMAKLKELSLGRFQWFDANVVVIWQPAGRPAMLVGANVLLEHDMELDGRRIVFFAPSGCDDAALGYWADDVPWVPLQTVSQRDLRTQVAVQVNGQQVRARIDSGSATTILDEAAARRLGAELGEAGARLGKSGSIGGRVVATVDSIAIGPEIVRHARVQVRDLGRPARDDGHQTTTALLAAEEPEMILGADFIQSHHLLFAMSQKRLYFSYLGGEVFHAPEPEPIATR